MNILWGKPGWPKCYFSLSLFALFAREWIVAEILGGIMISHERDYGKSSLIHIAFPNLFVFLRIYICFCEWYMHP